MPDFPSFQDRVNRLTSEERYAVAGHEYRRRTYTTDTCAECGEPEGSHGAATARGLRSTIERSILGRTATAGAVEAARQVHAAGYRKRRTLTTLEELHALPERSVIRTGPETDHYTTERLSDGWHTAGLREPFIPNEFWLPATVLFDPSEEN